MATPEYPPKSYDQLKRAQLLTVAIALEDQRDRALQSVADLQAQVVELTAKVGSQHEAISRVRGFCRPGRPVVFAADVLREMGARS